MRVGRISNDDASLTRWGRLLRSRPQAPPGTHLPQDIVDGLAKVRSAMLIYRHTPQFDANDEKWSNYTL